MSLPETRRLSLALTGSLSGLLMGLIVAAGAAPAFTPLDALTQKTTLIKIDTKPSDTNSITQRLDRTNPDKKNVDKIDYAMQVQPLLKARCYSCHGPDSQQGALRMDTREAMLKGGASGTALIPGKSNVSRLIQRVVGQGGPRMPLGFAPLTAQQTAILRAWIEQGASVSGEKGGLGRHWAYIPPTLPKPPTVKQKAYQAYKTWPRNPIDNFILARLEKETLTPSPEASKTALLRRVSLDLTGLPPTVEEIKAFLDDNSRDAYEKVVDRLLASPRYGERWARPWLDLARYADTNGYEKDSRRSMWPYRDYVINAFNKDMPFDRFTVEQLAGDLLPNPTPEQRIATGFHRNTMFNDEGGVDREEQRWLTIVDRVSTTASVWTGVTLMCAQCHNHKYDPFTQKDYYRFFAFFDRAQEQDFAVPGAPANATTLVMQENPDPTPPTTFMRVKGAFLVKGEQVSAGTPDILPPLPNNAPVNRLGLARWLVDPRNPLTARVTVNRYWEQLFGTGLVETTEDFGVQGKRPTHPELLDWLASSFAAKDEEKIESATTPEHPNTRTPLTPDTQHPTPYACGWSVKKLLRLMVTSATYRQASRLTPALLRADPANHLLARGPRFRMEAEMLRDVALSASGLLSAKIGGPSVFPLQPDGIWNIPYSGDQWQVSQGEDRYRRGLYTFWRRTSPYPEFTTFDATSREFCTVRRSRTNTPLQALTTLNDPAFFEAARALAVKMQEGGSDLPSQLTVGYLRCLARKPQPTEIARLSALYAREVSRFTADAGAAQKLMGGKAAPELAALTIVANVLLNLDETLNKE